MDANRNLSIIVVLVFGLLSGHLSAQSTKKQSVNAKYWRRILLHYSRRLKLP